MDAGPSRGRLAEPERSIGLVSLRIGDDQPEIASRGDRNVNGLPGDAAGRDPADILPGLAIFAALQQVVIGRRGHVPHAAGFQSADRNGADNLPFGETVLDPGDLSLGCGRQFGAVGKVAVGQHFHGEGAAGGGYFRAAFCHGPVIFGKPDGHHGDVRIPGLDRGSATDILEFADGCIGLREQQDLRFLRLAGSGDLQGPPGKLLHGILRFDPGTAGRTPSRSRCDGNLHAEGIRVTDGIAEGIFPAILHVGEALDDRLGGPHHVAAGIELLHAADSGAVHPLQVGLDALFGYVAVHPMPPDPYAGLLGRVEERLGEILGTESETQQCGCGRNEDPFKHGRLRFCHKIRNCEVYSNLEKCFLNFVF